MRFVSPGADGRFERFKEFISGSEADTDFLEMAASLHFLEAGVNLPRGQIFQRVLGKRPGFSEAECRKVQSRLEEWGVIPGGGAARRRRQRGRRRRSSARTAMRRARGGLRRFPRSRIRWNAGPLTRGYTTCCSTRRWATKRSSLWGATCSAPPSAGLQSTRSAWTTSPCWLTLSGGAELAMPPCCVARPAAPAGLRTAGFAGDAARGRRDRWGAAVRSNSWCGGGGRRRRPDRAGRHDHLEDAGAASGAH